jgi:hypothetical protein
MTAFLNPVETHTPGTIDLLDNNTIAKHNSEMVGVFQHMASEYLARELTSQLSKRVRIYDNYQRLTFGRASFGPILFSDAISDVRLTNFIETTQSERDSSFFPATLSAEYLTPLGEVLRYSLLVLGDKNEHIRDEVLVTLFCHRVLVRPREHYKGFFHRDLAPRKGNIGTLVWYPQVKDQLIEGMDLIAYAAPQEVPTSSLQLIAPDYLISPSNYKKRAVAFGYPNNYAHGVKPGRNIAFPSRRGATDSVEDFIEPPENCFLKDLVIVTVSGAPKIT